MTGTGTPGQDPAAAQGPPLTADRLRADVAEVLGADPASLGPGEDLLDRGMDSIRLMSLVETWRRAGAETDFVALADEPTLAAWTALLAER